MTRKAPPDTIVSEAALQAAIDASGGMGAWEWNVAEDRACADPVVALLFNLSPAQSRGGVPFAVIARAIHPEDREQISSIIWGCVQGGGSYLAEYRVISPGGRVRWILSRGRFFLDEQGRPAEGRGVVIDITDADLSTRAFAARAQDELTDAMNEAADLGIRLHGLAKELSSPRLRTLTQQLLLELGRQLAQRESAEKRMGMH